MSYFLNGDPHVPSFARCYVNTTSDTFLEAADRWRYRVWEIIRKRKDVLFSIETKYVNRARYQLPSHWGGGDPNVELIVSCENQDRADERIQKALEVPFAHRSISLTPCLGPVDLSKYLETGKFDYIYCSGENYKSDRVLDFDWIKDLRDQCLQYNVNFIFTATGNKFKKDGIIYNIPSYYDQLFQAYYSGINSIVNNIEYALYNPVTDKFEYTPIYKYFSKAKCLHCSRRPFCEGCSMCGKCRIPKVYDLKQDIFGNIID